LFTLGGGQTNQALRIKNADNGNEILCSKKDSGYAHYGGLSMGDDTMTNANSQNGAYINATYHLNLSGNSDAGNEVIIWLLQVTD
jgi:hypothetical protein